MDEPIMKFPHSDEYRMSCTYCEQLTENENEPVKLFCIDSGADGHPFTVNYCRACAKRAAMALLEAWG